jgi:deoxyribodipyrimidine photo-lyase
MESDRRRTGIKNVEAFIEQLVVRRELSMNFVHYTPDYDTYSCIPQWAQRTLEDHIADPREHLYSSAQLMACQTHDPYWNAAMQEMIYTGFMHNYMRMYWGKKILEWTKTPKEAFKTTLALNNRYFLDGRDPNSYAGVAWIYGLHDRAWAERSIFGKIRYMAASGLKRKCDIQGYIGKVERLVPIKSS